MASVASYNPAPIGGVDNHSHAHSHMDYSMDGGTASPGASVASSSASPRDDDQHHSHQDEDSYTASSASSAPSRDEDSDAGPVNDASGDEVEENMHEESDAFSFATANNEGSGAELKTHDFAADEDDGEDGDAEDVVDAVAPEEDYVDDDHEDEHEDDNEDDDDQSSPHIQTRETLQDDVSEMSSDDRRRQGESCTAVPNNMSSYASSLNSNSSANFFNQPCDNNNYVSSSNDNNIHDSKTKSSSSSMIDQESFYSHISSPQARFEANKQAFESRFSSGNSVLSNYSTASKKSSKSVRRRDVITPLADFGDWNNSNSSKTASASPVTTDGATAGAPGDGAQAGGGEVFRPVPVVPTHAVPSNPESAMVLHSNNNAANSNQWTLPEQPPTAESRALVVHSKHKSPSRPRGLEPDEAACRGRSGRDPPGESPNERPFIGAPRVNRPSDESVGSNRSRNSRKAQWNMRNVQWVDPKTVMNERDIDFGVFRYYEHLAHVDGNDESGMDFPDPTNYSERRGLDADGDYQGMMMTGDAHNDTASANPLHPCSKLLTPKRIRIATISSGYKKANFFVREDLDQRIYFHDLEDAINYMAKRGYARMRKEDELEWMKLLGKAHGVVKVGPTKKKQRYRKGKLVLIMSKPITDDYPFRTPPSSSSKNGKNITTLALVARKNTNSDESTAASSHTSIGRSIRGPYKSYSEKFLAEQEEEKRILLGEPPRLMMLTNGPVDPEPQQELLQLTNGSGDDDDGISEGDEESSSKMSASKKSSNASEARMVNYRGGVMYFTPHQYEESDDDDDEETEEEEDNTYQEDDDDETEDMSSKYEEEEEEEEEATTNSEEESAYSGVESSHTDAESSTNSEMSSIARNSGVKIAPGGNGKSTLNAKRAPTPYDKDAMRKNRQSSPPDMEPISDDSEDSTLISGEA